MMAASLTLGLVLSCLFLCTLGREGTCSLRNRDCTLKLDDDVKQFLSDLVTEVLTSGGAGSATCPGCPEAPECPIVPKCPTTSAIGYSLYELPDLCAKAPWADSGRPIVYTSTGQPAMCDMGWIVIQRRADGKEDFYRDWNEYRDGFGDIVGGGDFWFGLKKIHRLTSNRPYELRIDFKFNGKDYYATYSTFRVFGESDKFKLGVSGFKGDAGDSFSGHDGMMFTTKDSDHDTWPDNCAVKFHGAWWYKACHASNLNGLWGSKKFGEGLDWQLTTGYEDTATFTEMKIRPADV